MGRDLMCDGIEPTPSKPFTGASTPARTRQDYQAVPHNKMVDPVGFEPTTGRL